MKYENLEGQVFGKLSVLKLDLMFQGRSKWVCICTCGNTKSIWASNLKRGRTQTCGCTRKKTNSFNCVINDYKQGAKKRDIVYLLSDEQFIDLVTQNCYYCGIEPFLQRRSSPLFNGIDRIDNTKGYTIDNCVPCCKHCNIAKNTMTFEQFCNWIRAIVRIGRCT